MKPAILVIGIVLCLVGGFAFYNMTTSYVNVNNCISDHGVTDECEPTVTSAGVTAILGSPIFIICLMLGLVLVGDGLL
jgi:hypothetical protein